MPEGPDRREYLQKVGILGLSKAGVSKRLGIQSENYLYGSAFDVERNPVSDLHVDLFHLKPLSDINPGAEDGVTFLAESTPSNERGRFVFEEEENGRAIPVSEFQNLRTELNGWIIAVGQRGLPFYAASYTVDQFFSEDFLGFNFPIRHQWLLTPTVMGDPSVGTVSVWRDIDVGEPANQKWYIELTQLDDSGMSTSHFQNGAVSLQFPESLSVDYSAVGRTLYWTGDPGGGNANELATQLFANAYGDSGLGSGPLSIPLFAPLSQVAFEEFSSDDEMVGELQRDVFEGILGVTPLGPADTLISFFDSMIDIFDIDLSNVREIGRGSDLSANTHDTVSATWNRTSHSYVFEIPLTEPGAEENNQQEFAVHGHIRDTNLDVPLSVVDEPFTGRNVPTFGSPDQSQDSSEESGIWFSRGAARVSDGGSVRALRPSVELEPPIEFGPNQGHLFEIADVDTEESVSIEPAQDTQNPISDLTFRIYDSRGRIVDPVIADYTTDQEIQVEITGDTDMFETGDIFSQYQIRLVEGQAVTRSTTPRFIGIGYPGEVVVNESSERTEVTFPRNQEVRDEWVTRTSFIRFDEDSSINTLAEAVMETSGDEFVARIENSEISNPVDSVWVEILSDPDHPHICLWASD